MNLNLSSPAMEALRRAGWSEDRHIDIAEKTVVLEQMGFSIFPMATQIMENLDGIFVIFSRGAWVRFDADKPVEGFGPKGKGVAQITKLVGERLCGFGMHGLSDLLVTETGRIIALDFEWYQYSIIENIEQYLNSMAIPSTSTWKTFDIPDNQRPPFKDGDAGGKL